MTVYLAPENQWIATAFHEGVDEHAARHIRSTYGVEPNEHTLELGRLAMLNHVLGRAFPAGCA